MKTETREFENGSRTTYIYDDAGIQLRTTDYDADGNIIYDIHYEHNELGDITGWKVYNRKGAMFRRFEVDYYAPGLESENREYGEDGNLIRRTVHVYDSENIETEEHYYDSQGVLRGKGIIERDENGEYIDTKYYDTDGNVLSNPAA
jgi:hypothetical protein